MNQTPEQQKAAALAELLQRIANGGELQESYGNRTSWKHSSLEKLLNHSECWEKIKSYWRVVPPKPEPRLVPWDIHTVPVGEVIRIKDGSRRRSVITAAGDCTARVGMTDYTYDAIMRLWEQLDGTPCGTQEEVQ